MGRLSTHILDTMNGKPAAGVKITLNGVEGVTNADGRLLLGENLPAGTYTLNFHIGDYFKQKTFLDIVPVTFIMGEGNYHVPLVCTPFSYSTYRGS
jgi:5-hydroxyisourate hydrolase